VGKSREQRRRRGRKAVRRAAREAMRARLCRGQATGLGAGQIEEARGQMVDALCTSPGLAGGGAVPRWLAEAMLGPGSEPRPGV
jgi:hypothetical protein